MLQWHEDDKCLVHCLPEHQPSTTLTLYSVYMHMHNSEWCQCQCKCYRIIYFCPLHISFITIIVLSGLCVSACVRVCVCMRVRVFVCVCLCVCVWSMATFSLSIAFP